MKNYRLHISIFALACGPLLLQGCATAAKSTFDYKPPGQLVINNEVTVERPFEVVWSGLVRQLAKGFYVVNNIEKESRLINVSFSTTNPEDYLDCGETNRTFSYRGEVENISYAVAGDSSYKYGDSLDTTGMNAMIHNVDRDTSLEGRINIYVGPNEEKTDVSVNVRYVLTIQVRGQTTAENAAGTIIQSQPIQVTQPAPISFNTNQPNKDADGISCASKGVLEQEILAMAISS